MRFTEEQVIRSLKSAGDLHAPLAIRSLKEQVSLQGNQVDAVIEFSIERGPSFEALAEIVPVATPKNILKKARQLADYLGIAKKPKMVPLVIAPYIGSKQAEILADRGISWIDLCGNMSVRVSNQIYIERTGKPNRFPDTAPIKKIFQGTSSLVSRALVLKPDGFESVNDIYNFINNRNANITLSTVSKVLKSLDEDLLIKKADSFISVTNQERLLERLVESYISSIRRRETRVYTFSIPQQRYVSMTRNVVKSNYLACGFYAASLKGLATTDEITILVRNMAQAREEFDFLEPDAEFGNVKFIETKNDEMWFNSVDTALMLGSAINVSIPVVDEMELYLEMMEASPRGPKIAEQLKLRILEKADSGGQKDN